jgi:broad specificity phosphatase PhoE
VLVVTSGGPIRAAQAHLFGVDQAMARTQLATINNCSALELVIQTGQWQAAAPNAT